MGYEYTIEYKRRVKGKKGEFVKRNKTLPVVSFKSEAWFINQECALSCPSNCTDWHYIQKSLNPGDEDIRVLDSSLKTVSKGMSFLQTYFVIRKFKLRERSNLYKYLR